MAEEGIESTLAGWASVLFSETKLAAAYCIIIAPLCNPGLGLKKAAYNEHVHKVRNFQEQMEVAERMLDWLEGSELTTRQGEIRVQDAYTLRCIPQIHGASFQVLNYVKEKLEFEMNAANDNPLIFDEGDETLVISGGNFHGQPVAFALDV